MLYCCCTTSPICCCCCCWPDVYRHKGVDHSTANSTVTFLSLRTLTWWSLCVWWSLDHCSGHSIPVSLSWWLVMMTRDHSYHAIVMTVRAPGVTSSLSHLRVTTEPGSGLEPRICHALYICTFNCTPVYSHLYIHLYTCVQCNSTDVQCTVVYKTENLSILETRICILLCTCTHLHSVQVYYGTVQSLYNGLPWSCRLSRT